MSDTIARQPNRTYPFLILFVVMGLLAGPFYQFSFNLLFIGYNWLGDMRGATIFFAIVLRLIAYPVRLLSKYTRHLERKAEREFEAMGQDKDETVQKERERDWLARNRTILLFMVFQLVFYIGIGLISGRIFYTPFTPERTQGTLYNWVAEPDFPLNTIAWIPLIGEVDLTEVNPPLNLASALGAAVVGLFEVITHNKTSRRDLLMYLVGYPAGAYFITSQVPSGFEFSMVVFEILTIVTNLIEKAISVPLKRLIPKPPKPIPDANA